MTFDGVLVVADPPHEVVWEAPGFGIRGRHAFRFPARPGGCAIQSAETFTGPGARAIRPLVRWYWRRHLLAFRRHLAASPEHRAPARTPKRARRPARDPRLG